MGDLDTDGQGAQGAPAATSQKPPGAREGPVLPAAQPTPGPGVCGLETRCSFPTWGGQAEGWREKRLQQTLQGPQRQVPRGQTPAQGSPGLGCPEQNGTLEPQMLSSV